MNDTIETFKVNEDYRVRLCYDSDCDHMYDEMFDNFNDVSFISNHRNYNSKGVEASLEIDEIEEFLKENPQYTAVPIHAYIHSGIALSLGSFNCRWDSGVFGYVLFKKGEFGENNQGLKGFVSHWSNILNGDVYGLILEKKVELFTKDGELHSEDWEEEHSCWGFTFEDRKDMTSIISGDFLPENLWEDFVKNNTREFDTSSNISSREVNLIKSLAEIKE
jgi:hypothetical protein